MTNHCRKTRGRWNAIRCKVNSCRGDGKSSLSAKFLLSPPPWQQRAKAGRFFENRSLIYILAETSSNNKQRNIYLKLPHHLWKWKFTNYCIYKIYFDKTYQYNGKSRADKTPYHMMTHWQPTTVKNHSMINFWNPMHRLWHMLWQPTTGKE